MNSSMSLTEIGSFRIEGHKIAVLPANRGSFTCETWDDFRPILGAELYGILRRNPPEEIFLYERGDSNFLQTCYTDWEFGSGDAEHFRLTNAEMEKFLFYYCNIPNGGSKIDWKEFGF